MVFDRINRFILRYVRNCVIDNLIFNHLCYPRTAPLALYIVFVFHLAEERRQKEKSDAEEGANKSLSPAASKARKRNLAIQQSRIHIGCPGKRY